MPQQTPEGQSQAAIPVCGGFWEARMLPVPLVLSWVQPSLVPAPRRCLVLQELAVLPHLSMAVTKLLHSVTTAQ